MGATASSPLPSHNSIYLLMDLPVKFGYNFLISIKSKSLAVGLDSPVVGESAKILVSIISDYIKELQRKDESLMLWSISWERTPTFDVSLSKKILEMLCNILHMPFIRIVCKITHSQSKKIEVYEKRLDIKAILEESSFEQRNCIPLSPQWRNDEAKCDILLEWSNPPETESMGMSPTSFAENLFAREDSKDIVIVAGNGAEIKCNKLIWAAHSNVLARMVSPEWGMTGEGRTGRIEMKENSEQALYHFVRYLYGIQLEGKDMSCDMAMELFKLSDKYKVLQLQECLGKLFLGKGSDWFTPNDLIELYFHVRNLDEFKCLHNYLLHIILGLRQEVRTCERFRELEETDHKAAIDLVWKLVDLMVELSKSQPINLNILNFTVHRNEE